MPNEQQDSTEGTTEEPQAALNTKDLMARLDAIAAKQDEVVAAAAAPAPKAAPEPAPVVAPPPAPTSGRISKADYDSLAEYASAKAQEAERFRLAAKYGLEPTQLEGTFESPGAMEAHAHLLQLQAQMADLELKLKGADAGNDDAAPADASPLAPTQADTGGPTGQQAAGNDLETEYARIRDMGKTRAARQQLLQTIYRDPQKRMARATPD